MSWIPEANESRVGANDVVMRDRREETAAGEIGGRLAVVVAEGREDDSCFWLSSIRRLSRPIDARSDCCEGSSTDASMVSGPCGTASAEDWASVFSACCSGGVGPDPEVS